MPKALFVTLLIAAPIILGGASRNVLIAILVLVVILAANPIIWFMRKNRYFNSDEFQRLRSEVSAVVQEHNEVVAYVGEIRSEGNFGLGTSSTGQYAISPLSKTRRPGIIAAIGMSLSMRHRCTTRLCKSSGVRALSRSST